MRGNVLKVSNIGLHVFCPVCPKTLDSVLKSVLSRQCRFQCRVLF